MRRSIASRGWGVRCRRCMLCFLQALAGTGCSLDEALTGTFTLSPEIDSYMNEALDIMQANSINRYQIDWPTFRTDSRRLAIGARTIPDLHLVLPTVVRNLGDRHSRFYPPTALPGTTNQPPTATNIPSGALLEGRFGYVFVPGFSGPNFTGRADSTQAIIETIDQQANPCGWIVDLRLNTGGNMYPMVAGVGPLVGDGILGRFVTPDSVTTIWYYRDGVAGQTIDGAEVPATISLRNYTLRSPQPPVAVLYGRSTASSGEATAISFRGRPGSRSFGTPTGGYSTANAGFRLRDGARIALTVAVMGDRNGQLFGGPVPPDESIPNASATPEPGVVDVVVRAAIRWLEQQPACAN